MRHFPAIVLFILPCFVSSYYVKIGILSNDHDAVKTKKVWSMAQNYSTMMSLEPVVQVTQWWSSLDAAGLARSICSLVQSGSDALVFLGPPRWNPLISSYSNHLGLPFISAREGNGASGRYQVSMLPDTTEAAAAFLAHYGWNRFVFIYDAGSGADQIQRILRSAFTSQFIPEIEAFWKASDSDQAFRFISELLRPSTSQRFVLATSERFADQLALKLARFRASHEILLLTPVGTVERPSSPGFFKLTKFSVINANDPVLVTLENRLKTLPSYVSRERNDKEIPDAIILHYDSSSVLNTMFNQIAREMPSALRSRTNQDCLEFEGNVPASTDFLKKVLVEHGATGRIQFDEDGRRTNTILNLIHSTPFDVNKIGTWSTTQGLQLLPEYAAQPPSSPNYESYRKTPSVKVTSVLTLPFLLRDEEDNTLKGFTVDFLDELFNVIQMTYELQLVKDGKYGIEVNGQWAGMVGELVRGEADLAVAPLIKTDERKKVVDFSKNIMTTGLNILMKKEQLQPGGELPTFDPFSFLTVWSPETWVVIVAAIAVYSAGGYVISRFIGSPDRVRALETKGTDNLSPCGSVWFTVGSFFCRDTGIYPRNLTHRLWTLFWWIFCIFIALLYVAMLTSSLIRVRSSVTTTFSRKTSQQLLKESLDTGRPILGAVASGSTINFFKTSKVGVNQQFGRFLEQNPQVATKSYKEGVQRVRDSGGEYAFVMESSSSKLVAESEPCDTVVTSGFLNILPYAVAMQKNSPLKDIIDHGVLSLMETGRLRDLYEKWWHNNTKTCQDPDLDILPKVYNTSMTLHEVSGIFYLFLLFSVLSLAAAAAERYVKARNTTVGIGRMYESGRNPVESFNS